MVEIKSVKDLILEVSGLKPASSHTITYDSSTEGLEPIYFFILDLMNDFGLDPIKLSDSFSSSEGSGHFGDLGQRKTLMQQQGANLLGQINTVLRSILNLIYDLREFKIRLQAYKDLKNEKTKDAALLSLKQIWMDKVDIQKGNSSIKAMAFGQSGFSTLIDAFLATRTIEEVNKLDLNQIVKRIVIQRLSEFQGWLKHSESELTKRYEIEKTYLKSQVSSLRLYSQWAKPYLKAAKNLEMDEKTRDPRLVKAFNTLILELTLLGKNKINVKDLSISGEFPRHFRDLKIKRDYYSCVLVEFVFRSIPQRVQGQSHYAFGGKVDFTLHSYALNSEEIEKLNKLIEESEIDNALGLIQGITEESLEQLKDDIDYFLKEDESEIKKEKPKDSSNPFAALFGRYNEKPKETPKKTPKEIKSKEMKIEKDNWHEKDYLRKIAIQKARETAFSLFDIYKKAHGMASFT